MARNQCANVAGRARWRVLEYPGVLARRRRARERACATACATGDRRTRLKQSRIAIEPDRDQKAPP